MAVAGTDTAIETADVALMDDDLRKIPRFIRLSRATYAILMQNITLALGVKAVFLALDVCGTGHYVDGRICRCGHEFAGCGQRASRHA